MAPNGVDEALYSRAPVASTSKTPIEPGTNAWDPVQSADHEEALPPLMRDLQSLKIATPRYAATGRAQGSSSANTTMTAQPSRKKEPMFIEEHTAHVKRRDQQDRSSLLAKWQADQKFRNYRGSFQDHQELEQYRRLIERQQAGWRAHWTAQHSERQHEGTLEELAKRQDIYMQNAFRKAHRSLQTPKPQKPPLTAFRSLTKRERQFEADLEKRKQRRRRFPPALTPEKEAKVKELLKTPDNSIVSTMPGAEVTGRDMRKLCPREWLNDEVINFYAVMLNVKAYQTELDALPASERPPLPKRKYLKIHAFTSFFVSKLTRGGYEGVKRWTKKVDLFACDSVLMPVNQGNTHWTAACINVRLKRFEFYDSMGSMNNELIQMLRSYLAAEHQEKKKKPLDLSEWEDWQLGEEAPQQENAYDCGVFTSQVLECLSRPDAALDYSQENMPYLRKKMVYEIGEKSFLEDEEWD